MLANMLARFAASLSLDNRIRMRETYNNNFTNYFENDFYVR